MISAFTKKNHCIYTISLRIVITILNKKSGIEIQPFLNKMEIKKTTSFIFTKKIFISIKTDLPDQKSICTLTQRALFQFQRYKANSTGSI